LKVTIDLELQGSNLEKDRGVKWGKTKEMFIKKTLTGLITLIQSKQLPVVVYKRSICCTDWPKPIPKFRYCMT
jgi:hypothetical protein